MGRYQLKDVQTPEQEKCRCWMGLVDWKGQGAGAFPASTIMISTPQPPSNVVIIAGCSRPVLRVQALRMAYAASGLIRCSASSSRTSGVARYKHFHLHSAFSYQSRFALVLVEVLETSSSIPRSPNTPDQCLSHSTYRP